MSANSMLATSLFLLAFAVGDTTAFADEIILSTSGCFGRCPVMNIRIKSNGDVFFYGETFTEKTGYYKGKLTKERFDEFLNHFRNANVLELERRYAVQHTDDETITTTFLRNDTILNSIKDYGRAGPAELVQAYYNLRHLYEKIELTPINTPTTDFFKPFSFAMFKKGHDQYELLKSESFLLSNYLMSAKKVEETPNQVFDYELEAWMTYSKEDPPKIVTDGRYYKVSFKKAPAVVYDIGFNFFKVNASFMEDKSRHQNGR